MSPVANQPSRMASAVASGRLRYSRNRLGPRTSISPIVSSSAPSSTSPSSSTRRTSTPGRGGPTAADRTEDPEHQAVNVKQRQPVGDDVILGPVPHLSQAIEVGGDSAPRQDRSLWATGRARRVDDERRVLVGEGGRLPVVPL